MTDTGNRDVELVVEAIRLAELAGYYPAGGQRPVDPEVVALWCRRVREEGFRWLSVAEHESYSVDYIVVARNGAVCSGQHRILGGLVGGNPVPAASIERLDIDVEVQPWRWSQERR